MVDIYPFKALRPLPNKSDDISQFICPPYDVISPTEREALVKKSPNNVVKVELADGEGDQRYENAASILEQWKEDDVLQQDRYPSVYLVETTYKISDPFAPTKSLKRYGILTALRLEAPGKGHVRPHEKTLPKAKEERLKLLRATRTHVSPIFGIFFDKKKEWKKLVSFFVKKKPAVTAREHSNLSHRLWKLDYSETIKKFQGVLKNKDLFIADGHHRYEVSWAFKEEQLLKYPNLDRRAGVNFVMAYVCPMEDPGLLMLPTHRLVQTNKSFEEWKKHLESMFDLTPVEKMPDLVAQLSAASPSSAKNRVMGWVHQKGKFLLKLKPSFSVQRCLPHRVDALRALDVIVLHDLVMEESSGKQFVKDKDLIYTRDIKEIQTKTASDPSWSGFILTSSGVESLAKVAEAGEVMPPKTTYFYPKVPTGLALMSVGQKVY